MPYLRGSWVYEFSRKRSIEAGFIAAPGYEFVVHGAEAPRDFAQLETGFNWQMGARVSFYGKLAGNYSRSIYDVSASGGFQMQW